MLGEEGFPSDTGFTLRKEFNAEEESTGNYYHDRRGQLETAEH